MNSNLFEFNHFVEPQHFAGRHALVDTILSTLCSLSSRTSYGVVGGRRFGKTSILRKVEYLLIQRLQQPTDNEVRVLPIFVSLKSIDSLQDSSNIFGFMKHQLLRATSGQRRPPLPGPLVDLGLPPYTQANSSSASLQELEASIENVVVCAYEQCADIRIIFLIDEMDVALDFPWTSSFFGNLRSLIYDSDIKDFVRLVLAGSGRYVEADEKGSELFNILTPLFLEAFDDSGIQELLGRAPGIADDIANEIVRQTGGHPFIMQHFLYYLSQQDLTTIKNEHLETEARRFFIDRSQDIEGWWRSVGEDGRRTYFALQKMKEGWVTLQDVIQHINDRNVRPDRGLKALCFHGVAIHYGPYRWYRINSILFDYWVIQRSKEEVFDMNQLDGERAAHLQKALQSAFPKRSELGRMVRFKLEENLQAIADGDNLSDVIFNLIEWAESEGRLQELIAGAREMKPNSPELKKFVEQSSVDIDKPKTILDHSHDQETNYQNTLSRSYISEVNPAVAGQTGMPMIVDDASGESSDAQPDPEPLGTPSTSFRQKQPGLYYGIAVFGLSLVTNLAAGWFFSISLRCILEYRLTEPIGGFLALLVTGIGPIIWFLFRTPSVTRTLLISVYLGFLIALLIGVVTHLFLPQLPEDICRAGFAL
jgi:hypothetical protein